MKTSLFILLFSLISCSTLKSEKKRTIASEVNPYQVLATPTSDANSVQGQLYNRLEAYFKEVEYLNDRSQFDYINESENEVFKSPNKYTYVMEDKDKRFSITCSKPLNYYKCKFGPDSIELFERPLKEKLGKYESTARELFIVMIMGMESEGKIADDIIRIKCDIKSSIAEMTTTKSCAVRFLSE